MRKRIIALLLALAMVLSLAACGQKTEGDSSAEENTLQTVEKNYTSNQAMDVFETIETVQKLKDITFTLQINSIDSETGEAASSMATITGECYATTKQANLTVSMPNSDIFTHIILDGTTCYVDVVSAAQYLSKGFLEIDDDSLDGEFLAEDMTDIIDKMDCDYVTIALKEDPWTTLEGDDFAQVKELISSLYQSIKKDVKSKVKTEGNTCKLTVGLGDLQKQLLKVTGSLTKEKKTYQSFLTDYIQGNFSALLDASGWTISDLMETMWADYEEDNEEWSELEADGDWNEWTMKLVTCGDEKSGYTLDFTDNGRKHVNYYLEVKSAEPKDVVLPEKSVAYDESTAMAERMFTIYMDALIYRDYAWADLDGDEDDDDDEYYDDDDENEFWDEDEENTEISDEIDTESIEGYKTILSTVLCTDDGISLTVPVPYNYQEATAYYTEDGVNSLILRTPGYDLEFSSIYNDNRTSQTVVQENLDIYTEIYQDDMGYDIIQPASEVFTSADGSASVAGMGYYDSEDYECNVTVITGNLPVKDSDYSINFDMLVYSDQVTQKEIQAITDMISYLGAEMPVTITKD
jgi:hypothetical protein